MLLLSTFLAETLMYHFIILRIAWFYFRLAAQKIAVLLSSSEIHNMLLLLLLGLFDEVKMFVLIFAH